ncbi:MAG: hypothetical protein KF752_13950 [Pirellulaceae bacterium]|nr:hypothetical protein [Pirellulaceae bacterium]
MRVFDNWSLQSILPVRRRWKPPTKLVAAFWDRETVWYLVAHRTGKRHQIVELGSVSYSGSTTALSALAAHLQPSGHAALPLVALLSRPEVDVLTLNLPAASSGELPDLVAIEVDRQLGESEIPPAVDFLVTSPDSMESQQVMAFAVAASWIDSLRADAAQAGWRLSAVCVRQLAALSTLRRASSDQAVLNIVVQLYHGEVELSLCHGTRPLIFRSMRVNLDDIERVAEQLLLETERCLTLLPHEIESLPRRWYVQHAHATGQRLAEGLRSQRQTLEVCTLNAAADWDVVESRHASSTLDSMNDSIVPLYGAAWDALNDQLIVNLLAPKLSPAPPKPWVRPVLWAMAASVALSIAGGALKSDVWQLEEQVANLEAEVAQEQKQLARFQEKSDQVNVVETWLANQVNWLGVLSEVSQRLPNGQNATVRRLNASALGHQGIIDLSVQVSQPEDIAELENRLRSVKYSVSSKRINHSPEAIEYPWQFETRLTFDVEPPDWRAYQAEGDRSESEPAL